MKFRITVGICTLIILLSFMKLGAQESKLSTYNVRWQSPGMNSQGSIPLGNGDIGVNAWVDGNGNLLFYVSKTDAWSENGQLMKMGLVKVSLFPAPDLSKSFVEELVLENGELTIQMDKVKLTLWVDAYHPTIQVDISSERSVQAKATLYSWRKKRYEVVGAETSALYGVSELTPEKHFRQPVFIEPDTILPATANSIWSCHFNQYSQWRPNLELQSLGDFAETANDPLIYRAFGFSLEGKQFISNSDTTLVSKKVGKSFQLNIYPITNIGSIENWKHAVHASVDSIQQANPTVRHVAHQQWWRQYWDQHYIYVSSKDPEGKKQAFTVTQGYILQRYMNACGGRGKFPIKFNGSIFTVDTYDRKGANAGLNADFRAWGGPYWWQNTRLPYWSMLASGDFQLMAPLFKMYTDALALRMAATKKYYKHDGAFIPETMNFWGAYVNGNFGVNRKGLAEGYVVNPYIRYYWQAGLELSLMMLDYYSFTKSEQFATDTMMPFVSQILRFYDQHYQRDMQGKIMITPSMSLETYHTAVNPLPEIAGLKVVIEKMLQLPISITKEEDQRAWRKLSESIPSLPTRVLNNDTLLAPAMLYGDKKNIENPELYAVFPYRLSTANTSIHAMGLKTFAARLHKENGGWQTNSVQAAFLGLADEAKQMVIKSFSTRDPNFRFPAFWGPNYDWTPDQDHGNVAMMALQRMLMQYENDEVFMFSAWPANWDVDFKISGPSATVVEGSLKNGKLTNKSITSSNKVHVHFGSYE